MRAQGGITHAVHYAVCRVDISKNHYSHPVRSWCRSLDKQCDPGSGSRGSGVWDHHSCAAMGGQEVSKSGGVF